MYAILLISKVNLQELILDNLPCAELYERSLMHRENITIVLASHRSNVVITFSTDGHIKFWRKIFRLVEFAKHFRAHSGIITCAALSDSHERMASVSPADRTIKLFDVLNFDLLDMIKLPFQPYACEFVEIADVKVQLLFISDANTGDIAVLDESKEEKIVRVIKIHQQPVRYIKFLSLLRLVMTFDITGRIEIWDPQTGDFPKSNPKISFSSKIGTDFYELLKLKVFPLGVNISNRQQMIAVFASDKKLRVFKTLSGHIALTIDESVETNAQKQSDPGDPEYNLVHLEQADFERRVLLERDIDKQPEQLRMMQMSFDETDRFLIYCAMVGVKFVDLENGQLVRVLGKNENNIRFMRCAVFQGIAMKNTQNEQSHSAVNRKETDPSIYASAHKSNKFYVFSRRMPEDVGDKVQIGNRDVLNEPSSLIQNPVNPINDNKNKTLSGCQAIIQTTYGEIYINLFANKTPKTVENFIQHSKNGYYNGMIFHRVQQGFMIQTGCPKGNGLGGDSIWGGEFQDEFHPELRHDKPFMVSMANAGPNTNTSQFFITVCPAAWLDDKHTIFGSVYKGMNVVVEISEVETDDFDKPLHDIKIIAIKIL